MGLRDEAAELSTGHTPNSTTIMRLIDSLNGDERDDVVALVWDDVHVTGTAVAQVLTKYYGDRFGVISDQQVRAHRNGKPRP